MVECDFLDNQTICHYVISHGKSIGIFHDYLVLAWGDLMVIIVNADPHTFQGDYSLSAQVGGCVERGKVKISSIIKGLRTVFVFEVEVLQFRANIECLSHMCSSF